MLKRLAISCTLLSLRNRMTVFVITKTVKYVAQFTRKQTDYSCLTSFRWSILWPPSVVLKFFQRRSHSPRVFHSHSFRSLPAAIKVSAFHLAMVMSSVPRPNWQCRPGIRRWTRSLCRFATDPVWEFIFNNLFTRKKHHGSIYKKTGWEQTVLTCLYLFDREFK